MEEDCDGLCWKYIIEEDKIKPDVVIITEPTNLNIYRGQRGRMEIQIIFHGVSSHGSAPERGKNAIYMASEAALRIKKLNDNLKYEVSWERVVSQFLKLYLTVHHYVQLLILHEYTSTGG